MLLRCAVRALLARRVAAGDGEGLHDGVRRLHAVRGERADGQDANGGGKPRVGFRVWFGFWAWFGLVSGQNSMI